MLTLVQAFVTVLGQVTVTLDNLMLLRMSLIIYHGACLTLDLTVAERGGPFPCAFLLRFRVQLHELPPWLPHAPDDE